MSDNTKAADLWDFSTRAAAYSGFEPDQPPYVRLKVRPPGQRPYVVQGVRLEVGGWHQVAQEGNEVVETWRPRGAGELHGELVAELEKVAHLGASWPELMQVKGTNPILTCEPIPQAAEPSERNHAREIERSALGMVHGMFEVGVGHARAGFDTALALARENGELRAENAALKARLDEAGAVEVAKYEAWAKVEMAHALREGLQKMGPELGFALGRAVDAWWGYGGEDPAEKPDEARIDRAVDRLASLMQKRPDLITPGRVMRMCSVIVLMTPEARAELFAALAPLMAQFAGGSE